MSSTKPADLVDDLIGRTTDALRHPVEAMEQVARIPKAHASPAVRAFARQLGVDLLSVNGSGPNQRVLIDDVQAYVRAVLAGIAASGSPSGPWGPVGAGAPAAGTSVIPRVTQHDDADITSLDAFRRQVNRENLGNRENREDNTAGIHVTMLPFVIRAIVVALKEFPDFNASLAGGQRVHKPHFHIGFVTDTSNGPATPVIRNAEGKGILQIAEEMAVLGRIAREGKLGPADSDGASLAISAPGADDDSVGGAYFTPIIDAPQVAVLGLSRASMKPVWDGAEFVPRLMLPLSLSYDHRVIDGVAAARFTTLLGTLLADYRRVVVA